MRDKLSDEENEENHGEYITEEEFDALYKEKYITEEEFDNLLKNNKKNYPSDEDNQNLDKYYDKNESTFFIGPTKISDKEHSNLDKYANFMNKLREILEINTQNELSEVLNYDFTYTKASIKIGKQKKVSKRRLLTIFRNAEGLLKRKYNGEKLDYKLKNLDKTFISYSNSLKNDINSPNLKFFTDLVDSLKMILGIYIQKELSEALGYHFKYAKSDIKKNNITGVSQSSLYNIHKNAEEIIKNKFDCSERKLEELNHAIQIYSNSMGYVNDSDDLSKLRILIRKLKKVLDIHSLEGLAEYMGLNSRYFTYLKQDIKKEKAKGLMIWTILISRAYIRANLILDNKIQGKQKKFTIIDEIIFSYVKNELDNNYNNIKSPLFLPLRILQCELVGLSSFINIYDRKNSIYDFDNFFGYPLVNTTYYLRSGEQYHINEESFLTALYKFLTKYYMDFKSIGLLSELLRHIEDFNTILLQYGRQPIKNKFQNCVRGKFLFHIIKALRFYLDKRIFIPRSLLSNLLFNDSDTLFGQFQQNNSLSLFIGEISTDRMINNIMNLKYSELSIGFLFYIPSFTEEDLEQFKLTAVAIINHYGEIGRTINMNEEIVKILSKEIFRDKILNFIHSYRPNWLISDEGYQREMDLYFEFVNHNSLIIEVNGPFHLLDDQKERDKWKAIKCAERGIKVIPLNLYSINEDSNYWDLIDVVDLVCDNNSIREICSNLGISIDHIEDVRNYYKNESNFNTIIKSIHSKVLIQDQKNNGFMHIFDFL